MLVEARPMEPDENLIERTLQGELSAFSSSATGTWSSGSPRGSSGPTTPRT
jgi:hypothetical protein